MLGGALVGACNVGLYQGPDRPDDYNVAGPPPPADFHCERGERRSEDTDHDGHPDSVVFVLGNGSTVCSTEDRNHDGRIDRWNRVENGHTVEQATDTNYDGRLDERARDTNGDGTLDLVTPFVPVLRSDDGGTGHD